MAVTRRVLLVETMAHRGGHFPVVAARLAEALHELGYQIDVLTSRGWALRGDSSFELPTTHQYGLVAQFVDRWADRLPRIPPRPITAHIARCVTTSVRVGKARAIRSRLGASAVIVLTWSEPFVAEIVADSARWLCYASIRGAGPFDGASPESRWEPLD